MTKAELVEQAAKDANVSKVAAAAALNSFMDGVTKALEEEGRQGHPGWFRHLLKSSSKGAQRP